MALPSSPNTRKEMYLSNIAGQGTALPSEPHTREEEYLDFIAKNGGGGGTGDGDMKKSIYDADMSVAEAGGIADYVAGAITGKVDKVTGKGLSTNDYDDSAKAIVDNVTNALDDKVSKSNTAGLLKNDGTVDTTSYSSVSVNTGSQQALVAAKKMYVNESLYYIPDAEHEEIADLFLSGKTYAVGDYCINNSRLYRCTTSHTGEWDSTHFTLVKIADEVQAIKDGQDIDSFGDVETALMGKMKSYALDKNIAVSMDLGGNESLVTVTTPTITSGSTAIPTSDAVYNYAFPRSEQAVLGAKNHNFTRYVSQTSSSVVWTANDDDSITAVSGTATGNNGEIGAGINDAFVAPFTAQVKIIGGLTSSIYLYPYDYTDSARPYKDATKTTRLTPSDNQWGDTPLEFYMIKGHKYVIAGRVVTGATANNDIMYPRLLLASDTDTSFSAPAMTNKELTNAVAVKNDATQITSDNMTIEKCIIAKAGNIRVCTIRAIATTNISALATIFKGFPDALFEAMDCQTSAEFVNASDNSLYPVIGRSVNGYFEVSTKNAIASGVTIRGTIIYVAK